MQGENRQEAPDRKMPPGQSTGSGTWASLASCHQQDYTRGIVPFTFLLERNAANCMSHWYANLLTRLLMRLASLPYVQQAIADQADLSAFKARPTLRILSGVFLIGASFVVCWPLISVLGFLALHLGNPWIIALGGPLAYGFSHLVFLAGMYLCGAEYTLIFSRWLVRVVVERLLAWQGIEARQPLQP